MTCPYYKGDKTTGNCDLKSQYYHLTSDHIENYCNSSPEYYPGCEIFMEHVSQDAIKRGKEAEKRINHTRLEQSVQNTEKTIERLHNARKLEPGTLQQEIDL